VAHPIVCASPDDGLVRPACRFFTAPRHAPCVALHRNGDDGACWHGDVPRHLEFDPSEHPVALQLGGSDPAALARARGSGRLGYDEDQPQRRLSIGAGADRQLRRLPDGRAGARRRLRAGDARRRGDSGHGQASDRLDRNEDYGFAAISSARLRPQGATCSSSMPATPC